MPQVKTRNGNGSKCCPYLFSGEGPARGVFFWACIGQEHTKEKSGERKDKGRKEKKRTERERNERKRVCGLAVFVSFHINKLLAFVTVYLSHSAAAPALAARPTVSINRHGRAEAPRANKNRPLPLRGSAISALPSIHA